MECGGLPCEDENTGADDGADAQQYELSRGEHPLERCLAFQTTFDGFAGIDMRRGRNRLRAKQVHWSSLLLLSSAPDCNERVVQKRGTGC